MDSAAPALEESWQVAVRLAKGKLTEAQRDSVSKAASTISEHIGRHERHHEANLYRAAFIMGASKALDDSIFGLNLARTTDPREFGVVFYVMSASATAIEACEDLFRYFRLVQTSMNLTIKNDGREIILEAGSSMELREIGGQILEWGSAVLVSTLRYLTNAEINPGLVSFTHNRSADVEEFERFFGCEVRFGQSRHVMAIPAGSLDLPINSSDPYLLKVLRTVCDDALARRGGDATSALRERAEKVMAEMLPHGKATSANVAKELALSTRTFARRLAEENTNFSKLLDELRRDLAMRYLEDPNIDLMQIAWLLGYSEVTSFNHAFRRWASITPNAARARLQLSIRQ